MVKFLIDVKLPTKFSLWNSDNFTFVKDIDTRLPDSQIWEMAKAKNLIVVTKDRDFYDRILQSSPPPKVIYIRFGNVKMNEFYNIISNGWDTAIDLAQTHKLVLFYKDRVEAIE